MKKIAAAFLLLCLGLGLIGCSDSSEGYVYPVDFYYLRQDADIQYSKEDGIITFETREGGHGESITHLLNLYFQGPADEMLVSPFPEKLNVISAHFSHNALDLILSDEFSDLTGIDLTVACACIARTCLLWDGVEAINIRVQDSKAEASQTILLTKDSIILHDGTDISSVSQAE
jgi:spore germination protein GerM